MFEGKIKAVEEKLREVFRHQIGADALGEAATLDEGITFNKHKNVFQACVKLEDQAYVKEFDVKEDAGHWIDILRSLHNKNLLKGHYSTLKQAAANRKATQDAYETILHAKQVLTGEPCQTFKRCPGEGTDIYQAMWSKYKQPVKKLPSSFVKIASNCLDRMREIGFKEPIYGELLAWQHQNLGWRIVEVLTHKGDAEGEAAAKKNAVDRDLAHVGFIHCSSEQEPPTLSKADSEKLKAIVERFDRGVGVAVIVGYPVKIGEVKVWEGFIKDGSLITKEVELESISRRVEGEKFLVKTAVAKQTEINCLKSSIQSAFEARLNGAGKPTSAPVVLKKFKRQAVMADGFCFWHAYLRCTLPEIQEVPRDKSSGAPRSKDQLKKEIGMTQTVRDETISLLSASSEHQSGHDRIILEEIRSSPQVSLPAADYVLRRLGVCLRISVAEEVPAKC